MSDVINQVETAAVTKLEQMALQVIANSERQVTGGGARLLSERSGEVIDGFLSSIRDKFGELTGRETDKEAAVVNFETLSLVQEEELDVMVALEGMVNAARNEHLSVIISFNTRLGYLFPDKDVDESVSPLDPEQIANAFQEAVRPLSFDAQTSLAVYRVFNAEVLKKLGELLKDTNQVLIDNHVIPDLKVEAQKSKAGSSRRSVERVDPLGFGSVEEETHQASSDAATTEMFSVMQNLLRPTEGTGIPGQPAGVPIQAEDGPTPGQYMVPASMVPNLTAAGSETMQPFQPAEGQKVEMVDQETLLKILTDIQSKVGSGATAGEAADEEAGKLDVNQSLGEILEASQGEDGVVSAIDRQSSDIINLVTLLYDAIWQDQSVPIPIKELIGRTQVTIIKVALADVDFFNNEDHPARAILNEYASAGIGWSEVDDLHEDPLYRQISDQVSRIQSEYAEDNALFEELIREFKEFMAQEAAKTRQLEQRLLNADERKERLDDIHELVTQKIDERVLGRDLEPFVEELLNGPFHKFMVMLVLKEGPGSSAWKQAINTIDVLLWSVQQHEHAGDRSRLDTINPRLLNNLRKAFRIAAISAEEIDELISHLERVQRDSFDEAAAAAESSETEADAELTEIPGQEETAAEENESSDSSVQFLSANEADGAVDSDGEQALLDVSEPSADGAIEQPASEDAEPASATTRSVNNENLAPDDPHMQEVDRLSVGVWVEFVGEDDQNTRCKLAAKINAIDKFIFVNRQGVKVVEKTKMGLARELRDGTVNIINDGALFSRALESVIGNLREHQHEQQTGSAYQPQVEDAPQSADGPSDSLSLQ